MNEIPGKEARVFRHGEFAGPGGILYDYGNFIASLTDESMTYPLTERGRGQVERAITDLLHNSKEPIDRIYASQFLRTQESAQVAASIVWEQTGQPVQIIATPLLDTIWMPPNCLPEDEFYRLEQIGKGQVAKAMFDMWASGVVGETPTMVQERIQDFLRFLGERETMNPTPHRRPRSVIFTHSSFASAMLRHLNGWDLTAPRTDEHILNVAGHYTININEGRLSVDMPAGSFMAHNRPQPTYPVGTVVMTTVMAD